MGLNNNLPKRNIERSEAVLKAFAESVGLGWEMGNEIPTVLGDFLCNLMHFCDHHRLSFDEMIAKGRGHYEAETRCCECGAKLTAEDSSEDADNACRACLAKFDKDNPPKRNILLDSEDPL